MGSTSGVVTGITGGTVITYAGTAGASFTGNIVTATVTVNPTYAIVASAGSNGSISPSGTVNVCSGDSQAYAIAASSSNT